MSKSKQPLKMVVAVTGASGSLYAQRFFELLEECRSQGQIDEVHVALSPYAKQVGFIELDGGLRPPQTFTSHHDRSMNVPFASGSSLFDAMVIIPCSMGTLGRIAHGYADSTITRASDVFLKEKRKLILVPRETPWNLLHARNVVSLMEAGATIIPAVPSFYNHPQTILDLVDTVIARVLDHLGLEHDLIHRWMEKKD